MKSFGPPNPRLRSPQYGSITGKQLDDATIEKYIRAGYYGEDRRKALLEAEKKPTKKQRKVARRDALSKLIELLKK